VAVPWARARSGFTLLFEALVMAMVRRDAVATLAALVGESDMRTWRIVHTSTGRSTAQDLRWVERVGIDETSSRRGHDYVSVFAELDARRGVFVVEAVITDGAGVLVLLGNAWRRSQPGEEVCQDMSEAFLKGTLGYLRNAVGG
jgi:transposase